MMSAQTISSRLNIDLYAILDWRVSEFGSFINSKAWEEVNEVEQFRYQFFSGLVESINKSIGAAANAIVKTIAARNG